MRRCLAVLSLATLLVSALACSGDEGPAPRDASVAEADADVQSATAADAGPARIPDCERVTLHSTIDAYFAALSAHDAGRLPLAPEVKFTENGQQLALGEGLWQRAGAVLYKRSALDPERCGSHTQATVEEQGVPVLYGVRLQLEAGLITEIETFVARSGEYLVLGLTVFSTDLAASDNVSSVKWEEAVPAAQRSSREELDKIADLYFESFEPAGIVAPIRNDCYRWENGFQTTFGDCTQFLPAPGTGMGGIAHRRYPIADVENGIGIGYVLFRDRVDFHMFKVVAGEVRLIQAVVSEAGRTTTGWEEHEQP